MKYDTWTKKHEEEYLAAKKRYETAYANKVKYTREKTVAETKKQQLINSINAKKSELKKVSDTYTDLTKTNSRTYEKRRYGCQELFEWAWNETTEPYGYSISGFCGEHDIKAYSSHDAGLGKTT